MRNWSFISGWNLKGVPVRYRATLYIMMMIANPQFVNAQPEQAPDLEFLEFLGEGIKVENEIIDPLGYQKIEEMTGSEQRQQSGTKENE